MASFIPPVDDAIHVDRADHVPGEDAVDLHVRRDGSHSENFNCSPPSKPSVVLFGVGEWGRERWLNPVLLPLARWQVISLSLVDVAKSAPPEIVASDKHGDTTYLSWQDYAARVEPVDWRVAFVVTPADTQSIVCHTLLKSAPMLHTIVLEKPGGRTKEEVADVVKCAEERKDPVKVLLADHYLLRGPVQYLLAEGVELLHSLGDIREIRGCINENRTDGPRAASVVTDLMIHLLHPCLLLFPGSRFVPVTTLLSKPPKAPSWQSDTYAFVDGYYWLSDRVRIPCQFECGKGMPEIEKSLQLIGAAGTLHIDLLTNVLHLVYQNGKEVKKQWLTPWNYGRLIMKAIFNA